MRASSSVRVSAVGVFSVLAVLALVALEDAVVADALPAAASASRRSRQENEVTITKYDNSPHAGDGRYRYEFELSDGSRRYEEGELSNAGVPGREALRVRGSFSRPRFDGRGMEEVMYYADEEGFHVAKQTPPQFGAPSAALIASLVG